MNMASEYSAMLNKHQAYRAPRKTPPPRYGLVEYNHRKDMEVPLI